MIYASIDSSCPQLICGIWYWSCYVIVRGGLTLYDNNGKGKKVDNVECMIHHNCVQGMVQSECCFRSPFNSNVYFYYYSTLWSLREDPCLKHKKWVVKGTSGNFCAKLTRIWLGIFGCCIYLYDVHFPLIWCVW